MSTIDTQIERLDLSKTDIGQLALDTAEAHMEEYETHRDAHNAVLYLHVVETNLMNAERLGKDASQHYERLRRLQSELLQG